MMASAEGECRREEREEKWRWWAAERGPLKKPFRRTKRLCLCNCNCLFAIFFAAAAALAGWIDYKTSGVLGAGPSALGVMAAEKSRGGESKQERRGMGAEAINNRDISARGVRKQGCRACREA
jgi:hypothetical protein